MIPAPLKIDLDKLQRVVATATGCITQGAVDHFMLRAVTRADYLEDDVLMVALTDGGSESCYAVELVDAERNDPLAVKVQGVRFSKASSHRWAAMLWRAWSKNHAPAAA